MSDATPFPEDPHRVECFGLRDLLVDPSSGLISGPGAKEQVDPKVMAVLTALARRPGTLVTRAELLEQLWRGGSVYDDTLTQCIYQLRQHLAAAGGNKSYRRLIKTLPKRGYLLNGKVLAASSLPETGQVSGKRFTRRVLGVSAVTLMAVSLLWWQLSPPVVGVPLDKQSSAAFGSNPPTMAVLPFVNASGDPANEYLSDGISDELRDRVSTFQQVRMVARQSSVRFRDSTADTREIGRLLGVNRIVEGRFNREGGRLMVSVALVDTESGFQLWSRNYEQADGQIMLIEQSMVKDMMQQILPGLEAGEAPQTLSSEQLQAHDLVLLGHQYERQVLEEQLVDEQALEKAIEQYTQAVALDPLSAEAETRLGRMLLYLGDVTQAEGHILRAVQLDPGWGDTYTTLGLYYWAVRGTGIGTAYRRAIELNPSDADALSYYASWTWLQGDAAEAVEFYNAALQLDPLSLQRYADLGYKLAFQGSREKAYEVLERLLQLFPTAPGYLAATRITEALGEIDEAVAWALKAQQLRPDDNDVSGQIAELLARVGAVESAALFEPEPSLGQLFWQRRYEELVGLGEELMMDRPYDLDLAYLLTFSYSAMGQYDRAIALAESSGLPGTVTAESRRANDLHLLMVYMGDLQAVGRETEARELAEWSLEFHHKLVDTDGWLPLMAQACSLVVAGKQEKALQTISLLSNLEAIPRLPWLEDLSCLDPVKEEPGYLAAVSRIEERIAAVRARIPGTLAGHGIRVSD